MATHSSTLAWEIPRTEKPGGLQSMGSQESDMTEQLRHHGISWSSLGGLKGVKPPEAFGERSRDWSLGHAGDEGPHLRDDGGVLGWFSSGGPRVRFLTRYDGEVSS